MVEYLFYYMLLWSQFVPKDGEKNTICEELKVFRRKIMNERKLKITPKIWQIV